jgi:hypothetical protein
MYIEHIFNCIDYKLKLHDYDDELERLGSGRGRFYGNILVFAWKDYGKPRQISVRIAGLSTEI